MSRVINQEPTVRPETAARVLETIRVLGFRRNDMARNLRSGRTSASVGLIIEDLGNPFYSAIASAVGEVAWQHETLLITASSEEDANRERAFVHELCERRVDGLLIVPAAGDHGFLRAEIEMGTPAVFLDRPPDGLNADVVLLDNAGGAAAAARHLLDAGHRRIGVLIDQPDIHTSRERLAGVRDALIERGVYPDEALVRTDLRDPAAAGAAVAELLDAPNPPTAFFCNNNRMTVGAVGELSRRGSDADVVGFDDFELSDLLPRPVTIVKYDVREIGRRGAELLFERIGGSQEPPRQIMLPTTLVRSGIVVGVS